MGAALPSIAQAGYDDPDVALSTWHKVTKGKRAFTKYFDPHSIACKNFQEHVWSKIEDKYRDDPDIAILEVNCSARWGLQMCVEVGIANTPELHWGDTVIDHHYEGKGDFDVLVEFIEANLRKPICSMASPDACPEEEREDMREIERLTGEYLNKLDTFKIADAEKIASQSIMQFGIKNPFKADFDDMDLEQKDDDEWTYLEWAERPEQRPSYDLNEDENGEGENY